MLKKLEQNFQQAESLLVLNKTLERYLNELGIRLFAFTYYSYYPNSLNKMKYSFSSKALSSWHKHFIEEGYDDIDTTLDETYQSSLPIVWATAQQLKEAKSPREKRMRKDAIQFGVEKGVSIPIHGPYEDFAILTVSQKRGEHFFDRWEDVKADLFAAAHYYYVSLQKFMLTEVKPISIANLNAREVQCLMLLMKQYSTQGIAKKLSITERTVNFHIQRLNKKLGTKNKYQSVIKALKKGFIAF